jgi:hypothetical protein
LCCDIKSRSINRPSPATPSDRLFWACLPRLWTGWQEALILVQPRTVLAWQHQRFRDHWRGLSQRGKPRRPAIAEEVRTLIRDMWQANPTWGSPQIMGELWYPDLQMEEEFLAA